MKLKLIPIIFLILIMSCQTKEDDKELMPIVDTFTANTGANGGIYLNGSIELNGHEISKIGFEFSTDSLFKSDQTIVYEALKSATTKITYFVTNGVEKNVSYYYRAFLQTGGKTYYGATKSIVSDGSASPEITGLSGNYGHIADTLTIHGHYFKDPHFLTLVYFSYVKASVLSVNDSVIQCIVPSNIRTVSSEIEVLIDQRMGKYESFTLYKPTITAIEPLEGLIQDTITLSGDHFDRFISGNLVFFNNTKATVIESGRKKLKVIVPVNIDLPSAKIRVNAQYQDVTSEQTFTLTPPKIEDITPITATFRNEITITGENFDFEISRNKVLFGNVTAKITYADRNKLKVIIPDELKKSQETISVTAQLQQATHTSLFRLLPPQIKALPQGVSTDQIITIEGSYFHPNSTKNIVTFENNAATIESGDKEKLTVKVPRGPYPRRKATVRIQLLDMVVEHDLDLTILDKWIMVSNNLPFSFYRAVNGAVVANNEAYLITGTGKYTDTNFYLWKLNPGDFSWTKSTLPFQVVGFAAAESNGEKIYVYTAGKDNAFWEFNPVNQQWTQRKSFPGARRDLTSHFSINGDIYVGAGYASDRNYRDMYKYSPSSDTWSRIADFPYEPFFMRSEMASFVINNIAYLGNGAANTGANDFWSYLPLSNEWKQIANFPDARSYTASFMLNNRGYVTGGTPVGGSATTDCWVYNPSSSTWSRSDNVGRVFRNMHFAFSLNNRGYAGGGGITLSGGNNGYDFYEYVP